MKKLLAIFVVALLATTFAFATHNAPETATAQFDVKVIKLLDWEIITPATNHDLPDVIAGQTRPFVAADNAFMSFKLTGENDYAVTITAGEPVGSSPNVTLLGGWGTIPTLLDNNGEAVITYTCQSVTAASVAQGIYTFTIDVSAVYSGI